MFPGPTDAVLTVQGLRNAHIANAVLEAVAGACALAAIAVVGAVSRRQAARARELEEPAYG